MEERAHQWSPRRAVARAAATLSTGLLAMQLVRCGGSTTGPAGGTEPPGSDPPPGGTTSGSKTYVVQGFVRDSVMDRALTGVTVEIAGKSATTDGAGGFRVTGVPAGRRELRVTSAPYRVWTDSLDVSGDLSVPVLLWRLAPWVTEIAYDSLLGGSGGSMKITWGDIEGDFPVDQQRATLQYATGPVTEEATTVLGITAWRRMWVFPGGKTATGLTMTLVDLKGHRATFACVPDWTCTEQ